MNDAELRTELGSPVGLGTFPFSGVFSPVDQDLASEIIDRFISGGGRYIETAPSYPVRAVDLGKALQPFKRDQFFLATKCVTGTDEQGNKVRSGKREFIEKQCEAELRRLGLENVDLIQAHSVPEDVTIGEAAEALEVLRSRGLTRFIGVSNVDSEQLAQFSNHAQIDFVQNRFSMIHRETHRTIEEFCERHEIWLNPYQVIERGQLGSEPLSPDGWTEGDLRRTKHEYSGEIYATIRGWVDRVLTPLADQYGQAVEVLALRWALSQPRVAVCVVGATKVWQMERNLGADSPLTQAALDSIEIAYNELVSEISNRFGLSVSEYRGLV
jgi:methylglyoxal reductase